MIEILRSEDAVRVSFLRQVLEASDIHVFVSDPGPWRGPVRVMVPEDDVDLARRAITEAEAALEPPQD